MADEDKITQSTESEITNGKVVESHKLSNENLFGEKLPTIKKGKVDSLTIFEISESELDTIERGSPNSIYLNFAIALLSIFLSFLTTLCTVDLSSKLIYFIIFVVITVISCIVGIILLILWWKTKNSVDVVIRKIRDRVL